MCVFAHECATARVSYCTCWSQCVWGRARHELVGCQEVQLAAVETAAFHRNLSLLINCVINSCCVIFPWSPPQSTPSERLQELFNYSALCSLGSGKSLVRQHLTGKIQCVSTKVVCSIYCMNAVGGLLNTHTHTLMGKHTRITRHTEFLAWQSTAGLTGVFLFK